MLSPSFRSAGSIQKKVHPLFLFAILSSITCTSVLLWWTAPADVPIGQAMPRVSLPSSDTATGLWRRGAPAPSPSPAPELDGLPPSGLVYLHFPQGSLHSRIWVQWMNSTWTCAGTGCALCQEGECCIVLMCLMRAVPCNLRRASLVTRTASCQCRRDLYGLGSPAIERRARCGMHTHEWGVVDVLGEY